MIAIIALIASFILRKKEKVKLSSWINVIALAYIVIVLAVNYLVGILL